MDPFKRFDFDVGYPPEGTFTWALRTFPRTEAPFLRKSTYHSVALEFWTPWLQLARRVLTGVTVAKGS